MADYYVDPVNGDDAWTGLLSAPNAEIPPDDGPWKSTPYALSQVAASDTIYLIASGTETLGVGAALSVTVTGLRLIGVDTSLVELITTHYVIDCSALGGTTVAFNPGAHTTYCQNVRLTGGPGRCLSSASSNSYVNMCRCRVDHFASDGGYFGTTSTGVVAFFSEFDNNGGAGLRQSTSSRFQCRLFGCKIHHNVGDGIDTGVAGSVIVNCLVYRNGGIGINVDNHVLILNNTVYYNTGHGILTDATSSLFQIMGNSIVANGGNGINFNTSPSAFALIDYNHYNGNTGTETSFGAGNTPGRHNITGDPKFESVTNNSEDFTPKSDSPLIRVSPLNQNIGALSHEAGSGGGGLLMPNKRGNKQ